jgi:putative radical SAM enzyme (TIGR03279 family)
MPEATRAGGAVDAVAPGAAARAGLRAGDVVTAVDGRPLTDVIDWWWHTDEPEFVLSVLREGAEHALHVHRTPGEALGVTFTDVVFNGVRECENACAFCFVSGLPAGLRPSLYVRDDDYRLSFLSGNFVTLTNLDEADVARIVAQRLSPLHVSVHAADPEVRARLICPTSDDHALHTLDELLAGGIEAHVQIVLVPGVNDGDVLETTLAYLAERAGILSVGCVPMGFTAHQRRWTASYDSAGARAVLGGLECWQVRMRAERGVGWVYAADEFYLLADGPLPPITAYDDFPQFENGIGMATAFVDEFADAVAGAPLARFEDAIVLVTGELFAPVLSGVLDGHDLMDSESRPGVRVLPVANALFGGNVSVTGLLGGADIAAAVVGDGAACTYLVPDVVVNSDGLLIDDVPAAQLSARTGADVRVVGSDAGSLVAALSTVQGRARS